MTIRVPAACGDPFARRRPSCGSGCGPALLGYAPARPFARVDDEQGPPDHAFVTAHHRGGPSRHHVNPRLGPRAAGFTALTAFARETGGE